MPSLKSNAFNYLHPNIFNEKSKEEHLTFNPVLDSINKVHKKLVYISLISVVVLLRRKDEIIRIVRKSLCKK